jgi:OOP family OmpA-OmpF porin
VIKEYQLAQNEEVVNQEMPTIIQGYEAPIQEQIQQHDISSSSTGDKDADGVDDSIDKCPHTPAGGSVDASGCTVIGSGTGAGLGSDAIVVPQEVNYLEDASNASSERSRAKQTTVSQDVSSVKRRDLKVSFESNSATIKGSKAGIREFASYLQNNINFSVLIEGYTDNSGNRTKNLTLSKKRAEAVKALLIKYGVKASQVKAIGKGDLNPIADNETEVGRRQNRRIEAVIK